MTVVKGLVASRGIAIGVAEKYVPDTFDIPYFPVDDTEAEKERFRRCREEVDGSLQVLEEKITEKAGAESGEIFEIQREFLTDPGFGEAILDMIEEEGVNAEFAVGKVRDTLAAEFEEIEDEYFAQRAADIRDLADRVVRTLLGRPITTDDTGDGPRIVVAHDLTPGDTASMDLDNTLALCVEIGGKTSHTAILSRSLGIPSLVGLGSVDVESGQSVIVDALKGELILDPDGELIERYRKKQAAFLARRAELRKHALEPARTTDGVDIAVAANIANVQDARLARDQGAEGVGLLRTEFLFLDRSDLPDEEEQYRSYRRIVDVFPDRPVIVRTLDVGGDKQLPAVPIAEEQNPFLGLRAIRLAFSDPERLLLPQIRAILRAGHERQVRLLFPMIGSLEEVRLIRRYLEQAREELTASRTPFADQADLGVMIEIPSAAIMAGPLAEEVDFFSIGTNDLTQYTLAVDRTNETVAELADYFHPAVIALIATVVEGARVKGRMVGMCGEMAGDPLAVPLLLGLGVDELSMAGAMVPVVKDLIRRLNRKECEGLAARVREVFTAADVRRLCEEFSPDPVD